MTKIRTRFAPSPTGYMHIGNLRTALYCYLIAKHQGGDFILRIEDTDQNREVEGATQLIYDILTETGLNWDEGPDKPGDCGPYIQSVLIIVSVIKMLTMIMILVVCLIRLKLMKSLQQVFLMLLDRLSLIRVRLLLMMKSMVILK